MAVVSSHTLQPSLILGGRLGEWWPWNVQGKKKDLREGQKVAMAFTKHIKMGPLFVSCSFMGQDPPLLQALEKPLPARAIYPSTSLCWRM